MRKIIALFAASFVGFAAIGVASAEDPTGAAEARAIIQSQLSAFEDKAVETAYGFAAPNIKRIFPSAKAFGRMVREGYPMVWNPSETSFLDAERRDDTIVQQLRILDQAGMPYIAGYTMIQIEGDWRIAGVQIKKDDSYGS